MNNVLSKGIRIGRRHGFDSGVLLDYIGANQANGALLVGRLLDRRYLDSVGCRALRARRDLLRNMVREEVSARAGRALILDVASGPARYLQDVAREQPEVEVICRDISPEELRHGEELVRARGLRNVRFEEGDAFAPAAPPRPVDILVVSGLYELAGDEQVRTSISELRGLLADDGALIFTTLIREPPPRSSMTSRRADQLHEWAKAAGFANVVSRQERVGLFTVTTASSDPVG